MGSYRPAILNLNCTWFCLPVTKLSTLSKRRVSMKVSLNQLHFLSPVANNIFPGHCDFRCDYLSVTRATFQSSCAFRLCFRTQLVVVGSGSVSCVVNTASSETRGVLSCLARWLANPHKRQRANEWVLAAALRATRTRADPSHELSKSLKVIENDYW